MPLPYILPFILGDEDATVAQRFLIQLLPPGVLWRLDSDSYLTKLLLALSVEFSRVMNRGVDFIEETDPRTATETLPDWEAELGLPDNVIVTIPPSVAERQLAVTQKLTRRQGQNAALFVALADACGYTATVTDGYSSVVARCGMRCGTPVYGVAWAYLWTLTVSPPVGAALTHAELEAAMKKAKPSQTIVGFTYL